MSLRNTQKPSWTKLSSCLLNSLTNLIAPNYNIEFKFIEQDHKVKFQPTKVFFVNFPSKLFYQKTFETDFCRAVVDKNRSRMSSKARWRQGITRKVVLFSNNQLHKRNQFYFYNFCVSSDISLDRMTTRHKPVIEVWSSDIRDSYRAELILLWLRLFPWEFYIRINKHM